MVEEKPVVRNHKRRFFGRKKRTGTLDPQLALDKKKPMEFELEDEIEEEREPTVEEIRIIQQAEIAYNQALAEHNFPSLPDPCFIFDYKKEKGFCINLETWEVCMNLANTPDIHLDEELRNYYFVLSLHEISHYDYCPYDGITNLKLIAAAIEGGVSKYFAPLVVNIFSDLLIDTRIFQVHADLMKWELKKDGEQAIKEHRNQISQLFRFLTRCYEILWHVNLHLPIDFSQVEDLAQDACKIIMKDFMDEDAWERKVKALARLLKDFLKQECPLQMNMMQPGSGQSADGSPLGGMPMLGIPDDVKEAFGNLGEAKNPDIIKSGGTSNQSSHGPESKISNGLAEQFAEDQNFSTFDQTLYCFGKDNLMEKIALWYRGKTKNVFQIKIMQKKPGGMLPWYPIPWRMGDPLDELDMMQTLSLSPVVIPNVTTRQWVRKQGPGSFIGKSLPDMLIVIDSSGSMTFNVGDKTITGRYHVALLAAFASFQYALQKGSLVAGINFSSGVAVQNWTNDPRKMEQLFLAYQGGGTTLPSKHVQKLANQAKKPVLVMIISDMQMQNWGSAFHIFLSLLEQKHRIVGFFIDGNKTILEGSDFKTLLSAGARFYCVRNINDLLGLVIKEVKENYE